MEAWKRLYRKKSAILVEQLFSILKELMPKRLYVKGLANVAIYILLAFTTLITIALAALKIGRPKLIRRIGLFKY